MFTKILVPTDFSSLSRAAAQRAAELATEWRAELTLLHVTERELPPDPPTVAGAPTATAGARQRAALQSRLESEARELAATAHLAVGNPVEQIVEYAKHGQFNLIVMATQGRSGLSRWMLGSVAEGIVRRAPCPVLTVNGECANLPHLSQALGTTIGPA